MNNDTENKEFERELEQERLTRAATSERIAREQRDAEDRITREQRESARRERETREREEKKSYSRARSNRIIMYGGIANKLFAKDMSVEQLKTFLNDPTQKIDEKYKNPEPKDKTVKETEDERRARIHDQAEKGAVIEKHFNLDSSKRKEVEQKLQEFCKERGYVQEEGKDKTLAQHTAELTNGVEINKFSQGKGKWHSGVGDFAAVGLDVGIALAKDFTKATQQVRDAIRDAINKEKMIKSVAPPAEEPKQIEAPKETPKTAEVQQVRVQVDSEARQRIEKNLAEVAQKENSVTLPQNSRSDDAAYARLLEKRERAKPEREAKAKQRAEKNREQAKELVR